MIEGNKQAGGILLTNKPSPMITPFALYLRTVVNIPMFSKPQIPRKHYEARSRTLTHTHSGTASLLLDRPSNADSTLHSNKSLP